MMIRSALSLLGVLAASSLLGGCVIKGQGWGFGSGGSGGDAAYDGPECDEVRQSSDKSDDWKDIKDPTPAQRALATACGTKEITVTENGYPHEAELNLFVPALDLREAYLALDDRHVDAVTAAVFAIQVGSNDRTHKHVDRKQLAQFQKDEDEGYEAEYIIGLAHLYAALAKPELQKQLQNVAIPADAKSVLSAKLEAASATIDELLGGETAAKKKIFVDLPMEVHARRSAYFQQHAAQYAKLDALEVEAEAARKGAADATAISAKLTALRTEYVEQCATEGCTYDPFYVEATKELSKVYLAAKQPLLAIAEAKVLARKDANQHGFAQELHAAQNEMALRAREAFETKEKAKNKGLDATTTNAVIGDVTPMRFQYGTFWDAPTSLPDLSELSSAKGIASDAGYVASVKSKGTVATIDFKTEYDTIEEPYGCVRTGRLEAIQDDGTLVWEEVCQYSKKKVPRDKPAPITVLASDAGGLKSGELLFFVAETSTHAAVITEAHKNETIVQLRGDRLEGKVAPKVDAKKEWPQKKGASSVSKTGT